MTLKQSHPPQAGAFATGKDEMINDRAIERLGGEGEALGGRAILRAWSCIATRVVMGEHQTGAPMGRRVGDDRVQGERGTRSIAAVAGEVDAPRLIVDVGNPQAFDIGVGVCETTGEEAASSLQPVEFQWVFGTLISHW